MTSPQIHTSRHTVVGVCELVPSVEIAHWIGGLPLGEARAVVAHPEGVAQAFDVGFAGEERGTGNGERDESSAKLVDKSSPNAVSAAAEYLPSCLQPTVVPSASLK